MKISYNPEVYWDTVAKNILVRPDLKIIAGDDEPYYRYKRRRFLELLNTIDFSGKTVLEIGSGPGGNLDFILTKSCKKITGVDISQKMIALSQKLLHEKEVEIIKINGKDLPFPDQSFDVVFTSTVLQHNTNEPLLHQLIAEICRVSRDEVLLCERIESKIKGHESNLGRPIKYYDDILKTHHFSRIEKRSMPIQASYFMCGIIRKIFNRRFRKEGEKHARIVVALQNLFLPVTALIDKLLPLERDVMLLRFKRTA
jgi:ubiquinone/menaquinone biosynthesis C-methylase UbiE